MTFHLRRFQTLASWLLPLWMVVSVLCVASCESDKPPIAPAVGTRDSIPVMTTYGVSKLISDSGVIRYKIIAEEWKVFDLTTPPRQSFEKGLLLEKFNQHFHIQMYITADTAFWYNQNLWELRGRVCVWNEEGTVFNSELLYWDMNRHEFYSNKYSHLVTPDREVQGHSFHSNEQMTRYEVNITQAVFPLPEQQVEEPAEQQDTLQTPPPSPDRTLQPRQSFDRYYEDPKRKEATPGHFK